MKIQDGTLAADLHEKINKRYAVLEFLAGKLRHVEAPAGLSEPKLVMNQFVQTIEILTDKWPAEAGCALAGEVELLTGIEFLLYKRDDQVIEYDGYKNGIMIEIKNSFDPAGCEVEWEDVKVPGHYVGATTKKVMKKVKC